LKQQGRANMERNVAYSPYIEPGLEHLHLVEQDGEIVADGLLIAIGGNAPFRSRYIIRCDNTWCVRTVTLELLDNQSNTLHLEADGQGHWNTANGDPLPALDGCIDVDITATPFTNTLPIRRLGLTPGASAEIAVAYIVLPELQLRPARQRYTCLSTDTHGGMYRYEGLESGFTAELHVDSDGLILNYSTLWKRVWSDIIT
jgi:hypothetical protein